MELPKQGSHIHLMGICGTAMGSLAGILKEMGYRVTGSDQNIYPPMSIQLENLKISVMQGYKKENLEPKPDFVIVGNVISKHFEEAQALLESDIPYTSLPKAMGELVIDGRESVVIAGTHGKTTTTSMMAQVAEVCGLRPGFLIGGIPENFGRSFRSPQGDWFIIEGDEYDTAFFDKVPKFIHYKPKHVIFTSLEFDHADIYSGLDEIRAAFRQLMELIPPDGTLIYNGDDPEVVKLAQICKAETKVSYGISSAVLDYKSVERATLIGRNQFAVEHKGQREADLAIKQFGAHNTLNALACYALARELKWEQRTILQGLAEFKGVKRRQEFLGEPGGVRVVEDFAHHPTAVRLTIESMREQNPNSRVIAVFEPRSATSRRKVFQNDYVQAFSAANYVVVSKPYDQSKIKEEDRFSTEQVINDLRALGVEAEVGESGSQIIEKVAAFAKKGDTVLVMSNGGFEGIYKPLLEALGTSR